MESAFFGNWRFGKPETSGTRPDGVLTALASSRLDLDVSSSVGTLTCAYGDDFTMKFADVHVSSARGSHNVMTEETCNKMMERVDASIAAAKEGTDRAYALKHIEQSLDAARTKYKCHVEPTLAHARLSLSDEPPTADADDPAGSYDCSASTSHADFVQCARKVMDAEAERGKEAAAEALTRQYAQLLSRMGSAAWN